MHAPRFPVVVCFSGGRFRFNALGPMPSACPSVATLSSATSIMGCRARFVPTQPSPRSSPIPTGAGISRTAEVNSAHMDREDPGVCTGALGHGYRYCVSSSSIASTSPIVRVCAHGGEDNPVVASVSLNQSSPPPTLWSSNYGWRCLLPCCAVGSPGWNIQLQCEHLLGPPHHSGGD